MTSPIRWRVQDRFGNSIYLSQERWEHIIDPLNHPEMEDYEEGLKETVQSGTRKQDSLSPQKYRYSKEYDNLPADNTHIVAIVLFGLHEHGVGEIESNNFIGSLGFAVRRRQIWRDANSNCPYLVVFERKSRQVLKSHFIVTAYQKEIG